MITSREWTDDRKLLQKSNLTARQGAYHDIAYNPYI